MYTEKVKCPSGLQVSLREMKVSDENLLASSRQNSNTTKILSKLLKRVCVDIDDWGPYTPNDDGIKWDYVLSGDRIYLIYKLSCISFGNEREIEFVCNSCGEKNKNIEIDISELTYDPLNKELFDLVKENKPIEVTLPRSEKKIGFNLYRGVDESKLESIKKRKKSSLMSSILNHKVKYVEGCESPFEKEQFIKNLSSYEARWLREKFEELEPGLDRTVYLTCYECGDDSKTVVELGPDFLFPGMTKKNLSI